MAAQLQLSFIKYKCNSYIMVEGKSAADRFFIIQSGRVQVSREVEVVTDLRGNILGPGELFGVVSAMSSHICIETVMALTDVTLISVQKEQYSEFIRQNTPVAMKIIQQFSQRLRYLDEALSRRNISSEEEKEDTAPPPLLDSADFFFRMRRFNHAYYAYQQYIKYYPGAGNIRAIKDRLMKIAPYVSTAQPVQRLSETERLYPKDSILFAEGEPGDELYIIKKGSITISKIMDQQEMILAVLKPGDIFGEMALLEDKPRMASAVVYEECTVMVVNRTNFGTLTAAQPQLITRLTALLAERIWLIYKQLANTLIENPLGRLYDVLQMQLEKERVDLHTNQAYICNFGIKELAGMAGIPPGESDQYLKKVLLSKRITLDGDKIFVGDASEVLRQAEYYRRAQKIGISRGDAAKG